jgi:hypothetical protein
MGSMDLDHWWPIVLVAILILFIGQRVWQLARSGAWLHEPVKFCATVLAYLAVVAALLLAGAYYLAPGQINALVRRMVLLHEPSHPPASRISPSPASGRGA